MTTPDYELRTDADDGSILAHPRYKLMPFDSFGE